MKRVIYSVTAALGLVAAGTATASAACDYPGGYMYTYFTCVGGSHPCDDGRFSDQHHVMVVSNIFYDDARNDDYPSSVFFDEIQIQAGITMNGRESLCYASPDEAARAQREHIADYMRMMRPHQVMRISMPDT